MGIARRLLIMEADAQFSQGISVTSHNVPDKVIFPYSDKYFRQRCPFCKVPFYISAQIILTVS